jgi:ABC-type transport system involved in cytochrome bd biosynthesis fused ATPase/permease subunit
MKMKKTRLPLGVYVIIALLTLIICSQLETNTLYIVFAILVILTILTAIVTTYAKTYCKRHPKEMEEYKKQHPEKFED